LSVCFLVCKYGKPHRRSSFGKIQPIHRLLQLICGMGIAYIFMDFCRLGGYVALRLLQTICLKQNIYLAMAVCFLVGCYGLCCCSPVSTRYWWRLLRPHLLYWRLYCSVDWTVGDVFPE